MTTLYILYCCLIRYFSELACHGGVLIWASINPTDAQLIKINNHLIISLSIKICLLLLFTKDGLRIEYLVFHISTVTRSRQLG